MRQNNKEIAGRVIISVVVAVLIIGSVLVFVKTNNQNILKQNEMYISDVTLLSADNVDSRLESALNDIRTIASMTSASIDSPDVDTGEIEKLCKNSFFRYIKFLPADGTILSESGEIIDVKDREAYINGMDGKSGICAVLDSPLTKENKFSFYAPVYFHDRIIGVICGLFGENDMQSLLTGEIYGVRSKMYICSRDGELITCVGDSAPPENMLDELINSYSLSGESRENVKLSFEGDESHSFTFDSGQGEETAYIASLKYNNWVLIQRFPPEIAKSMRNRTNNAGVIMVGCTILVFVAYIIFLLVSRRRRERRLIDENREINHIVESTTKLFARFAFVDLKNDSYHYIVRTDDMPSSGKYSDLVTYISQFYIEDEGSVKMKEVISPQYITDNLTEDVDYLQYEYHINRTEDRWENMSVICLDRENGKPVSLLFAIQNITDLKQKEMQSRLALKNAFDAAKSANLAKSEFLSRMSHDIRTPLNAIMGMTTVAAMHIDDKERLADCLNKITSSSRHLLALINDILDMSKIESGKVTLSEEPFNLAEFTESVMTIMNPQIKAKNQKFSMSTTNVVHEDVIGDSLRLRQVFVNILGNAVKFTPEGGSITVDISELRSRVSGKAYFEFVFTDTGIGMEESFIKDIFEPFMRSGNSDVKKIEGTGLGMPIAKNIVNMMDGDIKVESELGKGSKFTVRLYLTIQNFTDEENSCLDNLRILVADDDKDAAENTREILKSIGMDAVSVYGGEDAVREVIKHHEKNDDFSAVILDWQMPGVNGVQAASRIRESIGEDIPIIILSAYDWSDIEQEARDSGVNAFISKPLFRSRLVYVLKSLVGAENEKVNDDIREYSENRYNGKRVLLVEDNELNREIAEELLTAIGLEVEMAFDGSEAVDLIRSKPERYYDLVFMDIQMPVMNGYEATRAIRASEREDLKEIPIVAMSADAFSDDVARARDSGMNDHISKPVEIAKLSQVLEKWLNTGSGD